MHVALVSPGWPIGVPNGIVTYVHHLRGGLRSLGHQVTVLAFTVDPSADMTGVYPIEGGWRTRSAQKLLRCANLDRDLWAWSARAIADTLRRVHSIDPIDVVEMEESFGWFADVQRRVPMPVVAKLHGPAFLTQVEQATPSEGLSRRIEREGEALRQAQFVFAPSSDTITRAFDRYGIEHLHPTVIPNPISAPNDARYLWNPINCDPKLLLFVGRFDRIKGADFLLRAFRIMLDADPSLRLVFVGPNEGVVNCEGTFRNIWECIEAWFASEHRQAIDVRGPMTAFAIQDLRTKVALTMVCSRWENQPNTALEAMAQGCPVVAVGVGGVCEVIEDGVTGALSPAGDESRFAKAVLGALAHPTAAAATGARAREYVLRAHDPVRIAEQTAAFYGAAIEADRRSRT